MFRLRYLRYVLRHIWKVWCNGGPFYHDWSKLTPAEFGPYADQFYSGKYTKEKPAPGWDAAMIHHLVSNKHHPEYWAGKLMPEQYLQELVADWKAMGDAGAFYASRGPEFVAKFHPDSWARIGGLIRGD